MPILVFRHIDIEHLGWIGAALDRANLCYSYLDLRRDPDGAIDAPGAEGMIFLGGPMSANDNAAYLRRELKILEEGLQANVPILGMCLGSQLIAKALGARVYPNPVKEIGWAPVLLTPAGLADPVLGHLRPEETVLHWHGETFDLPLGCVHLARSERCLHQAFRYGGSVYGLQFHLEATPEMIGQWRRAEVNQADLSAVPPVQPMAHADRMRELSAQVFGAWAGMVAGRRAQSQ